MAHNLLLTCLYKYRVSLADELLLELAIELLALVNYAKSFVFCMSFRCVCGIRGTQSDIHQRLGRVGNRLQKTTY